ncbi:MAG: antibiotic biosynthesis monooxygenase [Halobacteriota archaeon]|nr:antibiotic biosynthesis monooxygenase [Halobacteriota archaeon]
MPSIVATLKIKEGSSIEDLSKALKELQDDILEKEAGKALIYNPHICEKDNTVVFYERYADDEALKTHTKNLPKNKIMMKLFSFVDPRMEVKVLKDL